MKKTKLIPRKRRKLPLHATKLMSMWNQGPKVEHNEVFKGNKFASPVSGEYYDASDDEKVDNVWFSGDSMLIRLEAIEEVNFDSLLSTIRRLNKDWEITKVIGESFLKIYF